MTKGIEKIKKVPLRELWEKEDKDFTKWLEENIDFLNDVLDFDITIKDREKYAGPFKVDLYGEDNSGNKVIIENQLEKTNHEHLGKLIVYLTNLDAKVAIWITSKAVEEHERAIEWLNEVSPDDMAFYLIKVEAIKIGSQELAAPLFTLEEGPSKESKQIGQEKKEYAQRHILRKEFWAQLLEKAKEKTDLHSNITPGINHWLGVGAGRTGMTYNYVIIRNRTDCELYIDAGDRENNKSVFDKLYSHKKKIEDIFGGKLEWQRLDERRASRIRISFKLGLEDKERWNKLQDKMIDTMIRFERAFKNFIRELE